METFSFEQLFSEAREAPIWNVSCERGEIGIHASLRAGAARHEGSSPSARTKIYAYKNFIKAFFVIVVLFVVCIWGYVQFTKKLSCLFTIKTRRTDERLETYTSIRLSFFLKHPPTWTITEYPDEKTKNCKDFQSPETMKLLKEKIDPGYFMMLYAFWPNINNNIKWWKLERCELQTGRFLY